MKSSNHSVAQEGGMISKLMAPNEESLFFNASPLSEPGGAVSVHCFPQSRGESFQKNKWYWACCMTRKSLKMASGLWSESWWFSYGCTGPGLVCPGRFPERAGEEGMCIWHSTFIRVRGIFLWSCRRSGYGSCQHPIRILLPARPGTGHVPLAGYILRAGA